MKTRGRDSAASLEVVQFNQGGARGAQVLERVERPGPPVELTQEQADEWNAVVSRLPADWFPRETHALLAEYCRHVVTARRIAQLIQNAEGAETLDVVEYDRLGKMAERESRVIASLATKMRLSQQTSYDKTKKKPRTVTKPWD